MNEPIQVLVIEDNVGDSRLIELYLQEIETIDFSVTITENLADGLSVLGAKNIEVAIIDLTLPDATGMVTIDSALEGAGATPVIFLTGLDDEALALDAMSKGAQDYLIKNDIAPKSLYRSIRYAIERKRSEEALAAETERLNVTLKSIADGVVASDNEGKIVLINAAASRMIGLSPEKAIGRKADEVFKSRTSNGRDSAADGESEAQNIQADAGDLYIENDLGIKTLVDMTNSPIVNPNGDVIGSVLVIRDITQQRIYEAEMQKTQKLEAVGVLAGGIAHDFNNILTGILGNISLAKLQASEGSNLYQPLAEAENATYQAKALTQQLLSFAKGWAPVKQCISVDRLLRETAAFALHGSKSRCSFAIDSELKWVEVDEGQIKQVISNLIINADQAMPEGGEVRIGAFNQFIKDGAENNLGAGDYVVIEISDEGIGVSEEYLKKIFDPYFTTKAEGSGLGLAISYAIIKKHSGLISAESELGSGAKFTIYLPAMARPTEGAQVDSLVSGKGEGRVLLMDDEEMILNSTGDLLREFGYDVALAREGSEAVQLYKQAMEAGRPFGAVILDLTVPRGMGGKETIGELVKIDPQVKAIVSSGYSNDPILADYKKFGFSAIASKPYRIRDMVSSINSLIDSEKK